MVVSVKYLVSDELLFELTPMYFYSPPGRYSIEHVVLKGRHRKLYSLDV